MPDEIKPANVATPTPPGRIRGKLRLEAYGEEMLERKVRLDGIGGRLYLPKDWVGCRVKIIRLD